MSDYGIFYTVFSGLYRATFPTLVRRKVKDKFEVDSWFEFCNRLIGVGFIMGIVGIVTLALYQADFQITVGSENPFQVIFQIVNPVTGTIVGLLVIFVLHIVGWAAKGGLSLPFSLNRAKTDIAYNFIRVTFGASIIVCTFWFFTGSGIIERTMTEKIIWFLSTIGVLSLILAPIFYGFGIFAKGLLELIQEFRWRV